jgi:hypothetical protein
VWGDKIREELEIKDSRKKQGADRQIKLTDGGGQFCGKGIHAGHVREVQGGAEAAQLALTRQIRYSRALIPILCDTKPVIFITLKVAIYPDGCITPQESSGSLGARGATTT